MVLQPCRSYWCWLLLLQYSTAAALSQWVQCARTSKQTKVSGVANHTHIPLTRSVIYVIIAITCIIVICKCCMTQELSAIINIAIVC